ncbi:AraC-type DNA-binding protein [Singulisphaera sp. GP187]|uniref:helix-turn-helix transcriptional regulator n=1 Tax=Singulisphaera sp. GP187 TaxID=1882752 RepID=UPI00092A7913|nr:AraC family transcriptional regulator [Singulisphaera sp. GP187]SIO35366.1 AraC-type DNA-binding protein [Singulisphaera sp. GP187]
MSRVKRWNVGLAASAWEILAAVLSAAQRQEVGSRAHDLVRRAKLILEEQREGLPVIAEVAAALGLSPSHLQHLFKQQTGQSPYQYHLQLKIQRAAEMLRGSDLPVKQIAQILQFRSVYHFSTLFKKKTGLSPSGWRADSQGGERLEASDETVLPPRDQKRR